MLHGPIRKTINWVHVYNVRSHFMTGNPDYMSLVMISAFVFATWIAQSRFYLNSKFKASSHLIHLYSLVCVRPGRKPRRPVFSQRGSYHHAYNAHVSLTPSKPDFYRVKFKLAWVYFLIFSQTHRQNVLVIGHFQSIKTDVLKFF